jgi:predicted nicotinamide N-methyase
VLYERSNAPILTELAACEAVTLVGESNRPGTPRVSASALAVYDVRTFPDVDVPVTRAAIYRFEGRLGFEPG